MKRARTFNQEHIVNVTGWQNNCGPAVLLLGLLQNWEQIEFIRPAYQTLLDTFRANGYTGSIRQIKQQIDAVTDPAQQQKTFTPILRQFMAAVLNTAENKENFFPNFQAALRNHLRNRHEGTDLNFFKSNEGFLGDLLEKYQTYYQTRHPELQPGWFQWLWSFNPLAPAPEEAEISIDEEIANEFMAAHQTEIETHWQREGFQNYIETLGDTEQGLMFTSDEMQIIARKMGIRLEIYRELGEDAQNEVFAHEENEEEDEAPLFTLKLYNQGIHWQLIADDLRPEKRQRLNLSILDSELNKDSLLAEWVIAALEPNCQGKALLFRQANDKLNKYLDNNLNENDEVNQQRFEALFKKLQIK